MELHAYLPLKFRSTRVPMFTLGGSQLANKDSFEYLGMIFTKTHNMAAAAERMLTPLWLVVVESGS